jgi:lysophospholipase L1-like esterase
MKQKIVIIGDSHTRNCAVELQHAMGKEYSVISLVKPGAGMGLIVNAVSDEIKKLKGDDVLVIGGGSNDIGKNANTNLALRHLSSFIKDNQVPNIVVMTAPPRHNLHSLSCVNSEVNRFNKQLRRRMMQFNNVKLLETDIDRTYFTRHGLHFNSSGKEYIASKLATVVKSFSQKERSSPIYMTWKAEPVPINHDDSKTNLDPGLSDVSTLRVNGPSNTSINGDKSYIEVSDSKHTVCCADKKSNRTKKAPPYQKS